VHVGSPGNNCISKSILLFIFSRRVLFLDTLDIELSEFDLTSDDKLFDDENAFIRSL
jgi:hypothetical protein